MAGKRTTASSTRLPLLLDGGDGTKKWRVDVDLNGNLVFQTVGSSGGWETRKTLTTTGAWI